MKKFSFKPSKPVSFIGFIGGLCFCLFGFFYAIPNMGLFGVIWTILAVVITFYYAVNLFTKKGLSLYKIEVEESSKKSK